MLKVFKFFAILFVLSFPAFSSPLSMNGALHINGVQLTNEYGYPVQLRGMSSHGLGWHGDCVTEEALDALVGDWGIDVIRAAMYTEGYNGYVDSPASWKTTIDEMVDWAENRGIYIIIDWHILSDGNPNTHITEARDFFEYMSAKHAGKKHVIYEIANEPNGVGWTTVKSYAQDIIGRIRANDPDNIIIVGTPQWSHDLASPSANPLTGTYAHNVMYALHFYSGTHFDQNTMLNYFDKIPVFASEWGTSNYTGDGGENTANATTWLNTFASNSKGVSISWANWSYSDESETSAALKSGSCGTQSWNNTTSSGTYVKSKLLSPADNFVGGTNGPFTLTVNPSAGGTIVLDPSMASYPEGTVVTVTASPDAGNMFTGWAGDLSGTEPVHTITMMNNKSIDATFEAQGELISNGDFSAGTSDWFSLRTSDGTQASGTVVDGAYVTTIDSAGTTLEGANLIHINLSLVQGTHYWLSFDASSTVPLTVGVNLGRNATPWDYYLAAPQEFQINDSLQNYVFEFDMTAETDLKAKLEIYSGLTAGTWTLDNVSLRTTAEPITSISSRLEKSDFAQAPQLFQQGTKLFMNVEHSWDLIVLRNLQGKIVYSLHNATAGVVEIPKMISGIMIVDAQKNNVRKSQLFTAF